MKTVSIIVPFYNEETNLEEVIQTLLKLEGPLEKEFIFVNDGSKDNGPAIVSSYLEKYPNIQLVNLPVNQGKGHAIARGIEKASGEIIAIQDADLEYDPNNISKIVSLIINDNYDAVYGSRFSGPSSWLNFTQKAANIFLTCMSNTLSGLKVTDMETCQKVFRSSVIKAMNLQSNRFGIEVELTAYLGKLNIKFREVPITYKARTKASGKKIGWKDGVAAIFHIIRFNLLTTRKRAFRYDPLSK